MKTNFTQSFIITSILLVTSFLLSLKSIAQPDYDFRDPVLISGSDKQLGAVYIFSNVKTGVDARMTISYISPGVVVNELDGASGYPEALQPTLIVEPFTSGYMEMQIEFLYAGTINPFLQTEVPVTCIDVDGVANHDGLGNPVHEFDEIDLSGGYVDYKLTGSELSVTQTGNWFIGKNVAGIDYPGRDTSARQVMFTVVNGNISSCTIRVGVDNQSATQAMRLRSVYFKKFIYSNSLLFKSALLSFNGIQKKGLVALQWKIAQDNNVKMVRIERGNGTSDFTTIGELSVNGTNSQQGNFSFQDNNYFEGNVSYRLKLIYEQGHVKYSNVLRFHSGIAENDFKMYPSVIQNSATIQVKSESTGAAIFQLVDYSGRVVLQKNVMVQEGTNNILLNELATIHTGNYIAFIKVKNKVYNQKIFKQ